MAFWCTFLMRALMMGLGMVRSLSFFIECLCMAPLTLLVTVMRGFYFPSVDSSSVY
jgi:hypothetical protein